MKSWFGKDSGARRTNLHKLLGGFTLAMTIGSFVATMLGTGSLFGHQLFSPIGNAQSALTASSAFQIAGGAVGIVNFALVTHHNWGNTNGVVAAKIERKNSQQAAAKSAQKDSGAEAAAARPSEAPDTVTPDAVGARGGK
jgi:hypothetical protein